MSAAPRALLGLEWFSLALVGLSTAMLAGNAVVQAAGRLPATAPLTRETMKNFGQENTY